jgi:predicted  nucleic acid-binding Zn-ribbon protein
MTQDHTVPLPERPEGTGDWTAWETRLLNAYTDTRVAQATHPLLEEIERLKQRCFDLGEYKGSGINRVVKDRDELSDTIERQKGVIAALTQDRDEWKQQHENLLEVKRQDLMALEKRITGLEATIKFLVAPKPTPPFPDCAQL